MGATLISPSTLFVWIALAVLAVASTKVADAETTPDMAKLTAENAALAARSLDFMDKMNDIYFDAADRLNGDQNRIEEQFIDNDSGTWDTRVARGPVMEKAGRILTVVKKPTFQPESLWTRYFVMTVHPKTPLVGIMQASLIIQFYPDGTSALMGVIDVMVTAMSQEDLDEIKRAVEVVYQAHGVDGEKHRRKACEASPDQNHTYHRRSACVGGGFFGREMMSVNEENFNFYTEAYQTFVEAYLNVLERRKDDTYTEEDVSAQDAMRKNWFEDRLFVDPNTTQFTPYETWSLYSLPPTVKF